MKCCLDRVLALVTGSGDPEAEAHMLECAGCRADLRLLRLVRDAMIEREFAVSDELNAKTMARIRELARSEGLSQ